MLNLSSGPHNKTVESSLMIQDIFNGDPILYLSSYFRDHASVLYYKILTIDRTKPIMRRFTWRFDGFLIVVPLLDHSNYSYYEIGVRLF